MCGMAHLRDGQRFRVTRWSLGEWWICWGKARGHAPAIWRGLAGALLLLHGAGKRRFLGPGRGVFADLLGDDIHQTLHECFGSRGFGGWSAARRTVKSIRGAIQIYVLLTQLLNEVSEEHGLCDRVGWRKAGTFAIGKGAGREIGSSMEC